MEKKGFYTMEELKQKWAEEEAYRLEHKLIAFFEDVRDFFRWTIPRVLNDWRYEVKWAYQRVVRGYDDSAKWSLNGYITDIALPCLVSMRDNMHGCPGYLADGTTVEEGMKKWREILNKMIFSFELMHEEEYGNYVNRTSEEWEEWNKKVKEGLHLFVEHYHSLWD